MIKIEIPSWAHDVAFLICKARESHFRNQFKIRKMEEAVADDPELVKHVEGVIGYIGDICACCLLGIDPKEQLRTMVAETDLLTHRDEYDIAYRGWRIDVKVEFYPDVYFDKILNQTITEKEAYGCRLINANQFRQNAHTIDQYLFSTMDNMDPRIARYWYPVGWIQKEKIIKECPSPLSVSPAGLSLHTPAYIIPTRILNPSDSLVDLPEKPAELPQGRNRPQTMDEIKKIRYEAFLETLGLQR